MAPRIRSRSFLPSSTSSESASIPFTCWQCVVRSFSSSPPVETRQRRRMFEWLNGPGAVFRDHRPNVTNYLNAYDREGRLIRGGGKSRPMEELDDVMPQEGATKDTTKAIELPRESIRDLRPYPNNQVFWSQRVLNDNLKNEIVRRANEGKSVRVISAELGVEMRRVGAVIRLKSVEEKWVKEGKPLATPYAKSITSMLPQTYYSPRTNHSIVDGQVTRHESISDLPVHGATREQIFHPVAESRIFTRADAGKVFQADLLPADERVPHPELIDLVKAGRSQMRKEEVLSAFEEKMKGEEAARLATLQKVHEAKERHTTIVPREGVRADYVFTDIRVDQHTVGRSGRGLFGVGARYGFPHEDRKKGQIKIPRRVEA